ncbi:hypothetical protein [Burkholderia ubonensis]|uniref:hypothetical protein n=1 Tax=Burkholderia ubonensis TaxID=101571 RepID=UPI00075E3819|nr:hypothetical protein [Burkholderia ubonensis]KVD26433.1 hypothetical protein WI83_25745 [Burkholderia ubonensis]
MPDANGDDLLDLTQAGGAGFDANEVSFNIEKEKIALARLVLLGLAILFGVSFVAYVAKCQYIDGNSAKTAFEFVREAFPPIVTLVLGAYFTRRGD